MSKWQEGQSGNPSGRPKGMAGIAKMIFEKTRNGAALVEWAMDIWTDPEAPFENRRWAFEWLADRCMGKPVAMNLIAGIVGGMDENGKPKRNLASLSDAAIELVEAGFRMGLEEEKPRAQPVIEAQAREVKP